MRYNKRGSYFLPPSPLCRFHGKPFRSKITHISYIIGSGEVIPCRWHGARIYVVELLGPHGIVLPKIRSTPRIYCKQRLYCAHITFIDRAVRINHRFRFVPDGFVALFAVARLRPLDGASSNLGGKPRK